MLHEVAAAESAPIRLRHSLRCAAPTKNGSTVGVIGECWLARWLMATAAAAASNKAAG